MKNGKLRSCGWVQPRKAAAACLSAVDVDFFPRLRRIVVWNQRQARPQGRFQIESVMNRQMMAIRKPYANRQ